MAAGAEARIEHRVVDWATARGWLALKMAVTHYPDRLFISPSGRHAWVEFKSQTGVLRFGQRDRIAELQRRGVPVLVSSSAEESETFLSRVDSADGRGKGAASGGVS